MISVDLKLKERQHGNFKIIKEVLPAGEIIPIVDIRESFFTRRKEETIVLNNDLDIFKLIKIGDGVWMSTSPQEVRQMNEDVSHMSGKVLVGGLGLGVVIKILNNNPLVKEILVIEKEMDVIDLVYYKVNSSKTTILCTDLFNFLKTTKEKFDYAYYDIWAPTGEQVLNTHIRPLRKLSKGKIKQDNITCWQEQTMIGQLNFSICGDISIPDEFINWKSIDNDHFIKSYNWSSTVWAYRNWYRMTRPSNEEAMLMARNYVQTYPYEYKWNKIWKKWRCFKEVKT